MTTGLGPTDFATMWSAIFGQIASVRTARGLPVATMHMGQEWLDSNESPPRIVVIPTPGRYESARAMGGAGFPTTGFGQLASTNPKTLYRRWLAFDAYCWGNESSSIHSPPQENPDVWYSFTSAMELERELIVAVTQQMGGPAGIRLDGYRWEQATNLTRLGRVVVVSFAIETPVTQEPYIVLPYSTATSSGVQISATIMEVFPDGSSSVAGVIVTPP